VDDIVIGYEIGYIDGLGGTLGQAGCIWRVGSRCLSGQMLFEEADFATFDVEDLRAIVLHEMGQVLGLVATLGSCASACSAGGPPMHNQYGQGVSNGCSKAPLEFLQLGMEIPLYLENNRSRGTACTPWKEASFHTDTSSELMTGYFEAGLYQPISRVSVAALDDLGVYQVDYSQADPWPVVASGHRLRGNGNDNSGNGPLNNLGGGPPNSPGWQILRTKTSFNLAEKMEAMPPAKDIGHVNDQQRSKEKV
jgi:Leishmanolysin